MAPAGREVLVLGEWREGFYPIMWQRVPATKSWDHVAGEYITQSASDIWWVHGRMVMDDLTREDCEQILRNTTAATTR